MGMTNSDAPYFDIDPSIINDALAEARSIPPDDFRGTEYAWLQINNPTARLAFRSLHQITAKNPELGKEVADAALQGALLGNVILRRYADEGKVSYEKVAENHAILWETANPHAATDKTEADLQALFGPEASIALMAIRSPVARTYCSLVIKAGLNPDAQAEHDRHKKNLPTDTAA
jgi:hypothetical protein